MCLEHTIEHNNCGPRQKRRRISQDDSYPHEEIAWTATRCNRLLRTISSRLTTLRRLYSTIPRQAGKNAGVARKRTSAHWSTADPVWLPGGSRKSQGKTYAARAKTSTTKSAHPSGSKRDATTSFPSPLIKRIGSSGVLETALEPKPLENDEPLVHKRRRSKLPLKAESTSEEVERGLEAALETFLSATKDSHLKHRTGTSSLLQTCLRKVPAYIDLYKDDWSEDGTNETDAASEVFSELEALGTQQAGGWNGLRDVVRSQALHIVCQAITEKIIRDRAVHRLINVCSRQQAVTEGQKILEAWLLSAGSPFPERITKLNWFTAIHNCDGFKYRFLGHLLKMDTAIYARLSDLPAFENDLLISLSGTASHEALAFLCMWTTSSLKYEIDNQLTKRLRRDFESTIMKLAVVAVAESLHRVSELDAYKIRGAVETASLHVLFEVQNGSRKKLQKAAGLTSTLIHCSQLLAALEHRDALQRDFLTGTAQFDGSAGLSESLRRVDRVAELRGLQESFAVALAVGLVALERHLNINLPGNLLDRIAESLKKARSEENTLLKAVGLAMVDAAKEASMLDAYACNEYIRCMTSSTAPSVLPKTPYRQTTKARYRWEEGLCEWIKATPFGGRQHPTEDESPGDDEPEGSTTSNTEVSRHTSSSRKDCSPDVLANSSKVKRVRLRPQRRLERPFQGRKAFVVIDRCERLKFGRPNRVLAREDVEESSDELAL